MNDELARIRSMLAQIAEAQRLQDILSEAYSKMGHDLRNQLQIKMFEKHREDQKAQTQDKLPPQKPDQ